jgi:cell division septal protein FtsQ
MSNIRRKHIKNKIYKNRPKKSIFKMPIFWWSLLILILIITGIYFLLFYPKFQVQNIAISGNEKIETQDLENTISNSITKNFINLGFWRLSSKSIFLASIKDVQNQILNSNTRIKTITAKKTFPQNLAVQVQERKQLAVFCQNDKCFNIDDEGIVFEELPNIPENSFIVRQNLNIDNIHLGKNVIAENTMAMISEAKKNLQDSFQINLTEALISTPIRLDVKTGEGWQIYFNIDETSDINLQVTKLNLLLKDEITPDARQNLEYIDLRFEDRAYYK